MVTVSETLPSSVEPTPQPAANRATVRGGGRERDAEATGHGSSVPPDARHRRAANRTPAAFTTLSPDLHQPESSCPPRAGKTGACTQTKRLTRIALLLGLLALLAGCGGGRDGDDEASGDAATEAAGGSSDLSGRIEAGTVEQRPACSATAGAERFQRENPDVQVTVGVSGTGGGFERFCRGETDLSNASRPIKDEESTICEDAGVDFTEFQVANDAFTVVVNPENDWATCLTVVTS